MQRENTSNEDASENAQQIKEKIDVISVYHIITERQINEDRIIAERLSIGLLTNSLLLVAFFQSYNTDYFRWASMVIPFFGIVFSLGLVFVLVVNSQAMTRWYKAIWAIEQEVEFDPLKHHKLRPLSDLSAISKSPFHSWKLGYVIAPLFAFPFVIVWVLCLATYWSLL